MSARRVLARRHVAEVGHRVERNARITELPQHPGLYLLRDDLRITAVAVENSFRGGAHGHSPFIRWTGCGRAGRKCSSCSIVEWTPSSDESDFSTTPRRNSGSASARRLTTSAPPATRSRSDSRRSGSPSLWTTLTTESVPVPSSGSRVILRWAISEPTRPRISLARRTSVWLPSKGEAAERRTVALSHPRSASPSAY